MATSPNYAWAEPDNSSLVKNGAADIRTLGDAIDTSVWNVGFGQAGKNKIINGDFSVWQRGTTFNSATNESFTADRWQVAWDSSPTVNVTRQTFTPGAAPAAPYESAYFLRLAETATSSSTVVDLRYRIEDVRTFAGQTTTLSFWAKADSARTLNIATITQDFGVGGSTAVGVTPTTSNFSLTTSWQRFTTTVTFPSIAGKTIGTNNLVSLFLRNTASASLVFDIWGVQWEVGSKATPFQTATGTIQGELAACQRYYYKQSAGDNTNISMGAQYSATELQTIISFPVSMRTNPSAVIGSGTDIYRFYRNGTFDSFNNLTRNATFSGSGSVNSINLYNSSEISGTAGWAGVINGAAAGCSIAFDAEL